MDDIRSTSNIRSRGLDVFVDTLRCAEFDIKGYQVPDSVVEKIAKNLRSLPFSNVDIELDSEATDGLRVRRLEGYDVLFAVSREIEGLVVTIVGVVQPTEPNIGSKIQTALDQVARARGAFGV